jgi:hypothetical protein
MTLQEHKEKREYVLSTAWVTDLTETTERLLYAENDAEELKALNDICRMTRLTPQKVYEIAHEADNDAECISLFIRLALREWTIKLTAKQ